MPETGTERIRGISDVIARLEQLTRDLPDLGSEITPLLGGAARLGTLLIERGGVGLPLSLRRHESVTLRETATLLEHVRGLSLAGIRGQDLTGVRDLLRTRSAALLSDLTVTEELRMIHVEPGVNLGLRGSSIDPKSALAAFRAATGQAPALPAQTPERVDGLFLDYGPEDLPEADREETLRRITADPVLARFTHQELLVIGRLREIIRRVDEYGYGVSVRRRRLFSKARRAVLWAAPRIGIVMITHPISWRRSAELPDLLLDLRRYDRHMRDLAAVPEEDDHFDARDPLIRAIREDATRIRARAHRVLDPISSGPSAFRFPPELFSRLPGHAGNMAPRFLEGVIPIANAMAVAGSGGVGERDQALSRAALEEAVRDEKADAAGLVGTLRSLFRA